MNCRCCLWKLQSITHNCVHFHIEWCSNICKITHIDHLQSMTIRCMHLHIILEIGMRVYTMSHCMQCQHLIVWTPCCIASAKKHMIIPMQLSHTCAFACIHHHSQPHLVLHLQKCSSLFHHPKLLNTGKNLGSECISQWTKGSLDQFEIWICK